MLLTLEGAISFYGKLQSQQADSVHVMLIANCYGSSAQLSFLVRLFEISFLRRHE